MGLNNSLEMEDSQLYTQLNTPSEICESVNNGDNYKEFQTGDAFNDIDPDEYHAIFIPPNITSLSGIIAISSESGDVEVALKYGNPISNSGSDYSRIDIAGSNIQSITELSEGRLVYTQTSGNYTYNMFDITNADLLEGDPDGNWLYVYIVSGLSKLYNLDYIIYYDTDNLLNWCEGEDSNIPEGMETLLTLDEIYNWAAKKESGDINEYTSTKYIPQQRKSTFTCILNYIDDFRLYIPPYIKELEYNVTVRYDREEDVRTGVSEIIDDTPPQIAVKLGSDISDIESIEDLDGDLKLDKIYREGKKLELKEEKTYKFYDDSDYLKDDEITNTNLYTYILQGERNISRVEIKFKLFNSSLLDKFKEEITGERYKSGEEIKIESGQYVVKFKEIEGWETPESVGVEVEEGKTIEISKEYEKLDESVPDPDESSPDPDPDEPGPDPTPQPPDDDTDDGGGIESPVSSSDPEFIGERYLVEREGTEDITGRIEKVSETEDKIEFALNRDDGGIEPNAEWYYYKTKVNLGGQGHYPISYSLGTGVWVLYDLDTSSNQIIPKRERFDGEWTDSGGKPIKYSIDVISTGKAEFLGKDFVMFIGDSEYTGYFKKIKSETNRIKFKIVFDNGDIANMCYYTNKAVLDEYKDYIIRDDSNLFSLDRDKKKITLEAVKDQGKWIEMSDLGRVHFKYNVKDTDEDGDQTEYPFLNKDFEYYITTTGESAYGEFSDNQSIYGPSIQFTMKITDPGSTNLNSVTIPVKYLDGILKFEFESDDGNTYKLKFTHNTEERKFLLSEIENKETGQVVEYNGENEIRY